MRITGLGGGEDGDGVAADPRFRCFGREGRAAGRALEQGAAAVAADQPSQAGAAGDAGFPRPQPSIQDHAAADPGRDGKKDEIGPGAGAEPVFAPGRGLRVVIERDLDAEPACEALAEREARRNRKRLGVERGPAPLLHDAGDAAAGGVEIALERLGQRRDAVAPGLGIGAARRRLLAGREHAVLVDQSDQKLGPADIEGEGRLAASRRAHRLDGLGEPRRDVFRPGDRRSDDDAMRAEPDRLGRLLGNADAPLGDDGMAEPHAGRQQREIGFRRLRPAGIAGHGRADDVGAIGDGRLRLRERRDVGHREPAPGMHPCAERRRLDGADAVGAVEGDDIGAGIGQRVDILDQRRDADRRRVHVALDEADDRRVGRRAHRLEIGDALDAQAPGAARQRREREADHAFGLIERPARNRLAGDDERGGEAPE